MIGGFYVGFLRMRCVMVVGLLMWIVIIGVWRR